MRTLAVDPGGTTGIATTDNGVDFATFTTTTPEDLWSLVADFPWEVILCENFSAKIISKYGLYTVRLIGGVQAICHIQKKTLVMRTPIDRHAWQAFAQKFLVDQRTRTKDRFVVHQADALAHLMAWVEWTPQEHT